MTTDAEFSINNLLGGRLTLAKRIHDTIAEGFTAANDDDIATLTIAVLLVGLVLRDELRAQRTGNPQGAAL